MATERHSDLDLNGNKLLNAVLSGQVYQIPKDYVVTGEIKVASGRTDYLPGFFALVPAGYTATVKSCTYKIFEGTSVTMKLTNNGSDITGFTNISVTTTASTTAPTPVAVSADDYICPVVTAVSGSPYHISYRIVLELTKT